LELLTFTCQILWSWGSWSHAAIQESVYFMFCLCVELNDARKAGWHSTLRGTGKSW